ncbi:MAG: carbamoyl-phosphate synthase large subunit [Alphaproteobacteria bacterium]
MPKRTDIKSILLIGAGPIVIGQACEFDYSGTQAVKALKEEGYRVILVNSNPATIMTDPELADATYIEPITPEVVAKIISKERPDAVLPTMGGQTGLNTALELEKQGVLHKYGVELIGARAESIEKAEDRLKFRDAMDKIGLESPRSRLITNIDEADSALAHVGLPVILRPSFTLGGQGGGIAYNREDYLKIVANGLRLSPVSEVLVEESVLGWKEFEMEVVRDGADNCIIVCSIENIDPMGIHTGDSITVAPALTLTDKEYQVMRNASIAVLREIGVDTGGSNVQFAVDPKSGRQVVIEMNPRVSRSSALASKATGFPIAKIAAKLAVGYHLDELTNDITKVTPASFEPTIDYVVTKIPRFTFEKFSTTEPRLSTSMKSVGEAMALGRTFKESLQKALRSLEEGLEGLSLPPALKGEEITEEHLLDLLREHVPYRILYVAEAFRRGLTVADVHGATSIDPWFLKEIEDLVIAEVEVAKKGLPNTIPLFQSLKSMGFSDERLAQLTGRTAKSVLDARRRLGLQRVFKRIDTCAAEIPSTTPYLYSTFEGGLNGLAENEAEPSNRKKVLIIGGGPNRIGQGIEFDYCCVHAAYALKEAGYETLMVNCNPETVSTDYDTSDRLYFEPLTVEDVLGLARLEQSKGVLHGAIVQFGGQTPLKLASRLYEEGIPILGTTVDAIDLAEDRERFQKLMQELEISQPANGIATSAEEAAIVAAEIGYPVLLRPSYVLGGRAMEIVQDEAGLKRYIETAVSVSGDSPVLVDTYLGNAIEVDLDALCDGEKVYIAGIMEHIEEAGVHSGDSACSLPPYSLQMDAISTMREQATKIALAMGVVGLMNIQFAVTPHDGEVYVLEVNPRASRTVPFVAKATDVPIAKIAARIMAGEKLDSFGLVERKLKHVCVKEAVFPFDRFPGFDPVLGPEMRSTGEVMGRDISFPMAFYKSQLAAGVKLPESGTAFISLKASDKHLAADIGQALADAGFNLVATKGTAEVLANAGLDATRVNKVREGSPHIVDTMKNGEIALMINTTEGLRSISDSREIRMTAVARRIPYFTTLAGGKAGVAAIQAAKVNDLVVEALQSTA